MANVGYPFVLAGILFLQMSTRFLQNTKGYLFDKNRYLFQNFIPFDSCIFA